VTTPDFRIWLVRSLARLIDQAADSHEPLVIAGKRSSAVLVAEGDWKAIQETMYRLSVPGMRESIAQGDGRAPVAEREGARLVTWMHLYSKQALKDARIPKSAGLEEQAEERLEILKTGRHIRRQQSFM